MGNKVETREVTPQEDIWNFPYILNIAFIHRFNEEEENKERNYYGSKLFASILGKTYRLYFQQLISGYSSTLTPFFSLSIPISQIGFEEIKEEIKMDLTFYRENDFYFEGNVTLSKFSKENLGDIKYADQISLKLEKDEKKTFQKNCSQYSFDIEYRIGGNYILDIFKLENFEDMLFNRFFSNSNTLNSVIFKEEKQTYAYRGLDIIFKFLKEIKNDNDEERKVKYIKYYIDDTLISLIFFFLENKMNLSSSSFDLNLILSDFYNYSFPIFKQRMLYELIEKDLTYYLKDNMRGILFAISAGFISRNFQCSKILETIGRDEELLDKFLKMIDYELIIKFLRKDGNYVLENYEKNTQNKIFFYLFLSKDARKKMHENLDEIITLIQKDDVLNKYHKAITYLLKAEFENEEKIWDLINGRMNDLQIWEQQSIFVDILKFNNVKNNLYFQIENDSDNFLGRILNKQTIKSKIFEKFYELITFENSFIESFLTSNLVEIVEFILKRKSGYEVIIEETAKLSDKELIIILNRKLFKFFIVENFDLIFIYVWKNIQISNLPILFEHVFDSVIELYFTRGNYNNRDIMEFSTLLNYIVSDTNYTKKFIEIISKELICMYVSYTMKTNFNDKVYNILLSIDYISDLFKSNINYFREKFGNETNFSKLEELIFNESFRIKNLDLIGVKIAHSAENEDFTNSITKLHVSKFDAFTNIPIILQNNNQRPFYVTHIWLSQEKYKKNNVKSAIFISGIGEFPREDEIIKFNDFEIQNALGFDYGRFDYLGGIEFEENYLYDEEKQFKSFKVQNIVKSEFILTILINKYGEEDCYFILGGLGCFGTFDKESAEFIASKDYQYLDLKNLI